MPEKNTKLIKLTVIQRLVLLGTIPKEGDMLTVRILRDLRMELALTEDEIVRLNVPSDGTFNLSMIKDDFSREMNIKTVAAGIIKMSLQDLDKNKKLTEAHLDLWDLFCG